MDGATAAVGSRCWWKKWCWLDGTAADVGGSRRELQWKWNIRYRCWWKKFSWMDGTAADVSKKLEEGVLRLLSILLKRWKKWCWLDGTVADVDGSRRKLRWKSCNIRSRCWWKK